MRLVPEDNSGKITFFSTHVGPWAEHAAEIGTTPEEVAALDADVAEAKAAFLARRAAQSAAMAATLRLNGAIEQMSRRGANIVQQIRARAAMEGNGVYTTALIAAPAAPSPIAEPGTPYRIDALLQGGWLTLRWKCKNPRGAAGTIYHIERSVDGAPMTFLGATGDRSFIDATVPAGSRQIVYQLRAIRSTKVGGAARHIVSLNGDGMRGLPLPWRSTAKAVLIAA